MNGSLRTAIVAVLPALVGFGCAAPGAEEAEPPHLASERRREAPVDLVAHGPYAYRYYPDVEAYYDDERSLWFWPAASYWGVGPNLPSTYEPRGQARQIRLETDRPYRLHGLVRSVYPPEAEEDHVIAAAAGHEE